MSNWRDLTDAEAQARIEGWRRERMDAIDALSPDLRKLVHEYGYTVVGSFMSLGVKRANHICYLVETVLNEFSPTRGSYSKQGIRTDVAPPERLISK